MFPEFLSRKTGRKRQTRLMNAGFAHPTRPQSLTHALLPLQRPRQSGQALATTNQSGEPTQIAHSVDLSPKIIIPIPERSAAQPHLILVYYPNPTKSIISTGRVRWIWHFLAHTAIPCLPTTLQRPSMCQLASALNPPKAHIGQEGFCRIWTGCFLRQRLPRF